MHRKLKTSMLLRVAPTEEKINAKHEKKHQEQGRQAGQPARARRGKERRR